MPGSLPLPWGGRIRVTIDGIVTSGPDGEGVYLLLRDGTMLDVCMLPSACVVEYVENHGQGEELRRRAHPKE